MNEVNNTEKKESDTRTAYLITQQSTVGIVVPNEHLISFFSFVKLQKKKKKINNYLLNYRRL